MYHAQSYFIVARRVHGTKLCMESNVYNVYTQFSIDTMRFVAPKMLYIAIVLSYNDN